MPRLLTFTVDDCVYGVEAEHVLEVLRPQPMTQVPGAPPTVAGLINLRGTVLTALWLRARLGLPPGDAGRAMNVVLSTHSGPVSLLVDQVDDVAEVDPALFEPAPATVRGAARELVSGVYRTRGHLLHALDLVAATAAESRGTEGQDPVVA